MLVHVAVAFGGLVAFSVLTVDLGTLWVARTQAQNTADAGAYAAAVSLAYVDLEDVDAAVEAGKSVMATNPVWGLEAAVDVASVTCPAGTPAGGRCVRADAYRDTAHGTPLATYFATLFGLATGDVRASAVAGAVNGNATPCLRPWAIPDRWTDVIDATPPIDGVWTMDDWFEPPQDVYIPPTASDPGTGYTRAGTMGIPVRLVVANSMRPYPDQVPGDWMFDLDLPRADENPGGEAQFQMNIESCSGVPVSIGDQVTTNFNHPRVGQTAVDALIAQDPGAYWDGTHIAGSVAPVSPRLVAIGVFDPTEYAAVSHAEPGFPVRIRNIIGLFLERMEGRTAVHGRLVPLAGAFDASADQVTDDSSFLRAITMVR